MYDGAFRQITRVIAREYKRHEYVLTGNLSDADKSNYQMLRDMEADGEDYCSSLQFLSDCLEKYYGRKAIILIDEYFGFTDDEVKKLCADYGLSHKYDVVKEWYNGYLFGNANVYNPWSVIQYMDDHMESPDRYAEAYWANTSSNSIVRKLIDMADDVVKGEIELLIAGGHDREADTRRYHI